MNFINRTRNAGWDLFIVSALSLFCELLIIRWLSTEVRIFAYFKNLPLMAAFLGLGLGFLWTSHKTQLGKSSSIALLFLCGLLASAGYLGLTHLHIVDSSKIMMFGLHGASSATELTLNVGKLLAIFVLSAFVFVGLGQKTGQLFEQFSPLKAYSINVAGALAGVLLFTLLGYLELGPGVWLVVAGLMYLFLFCNVTSAALVVFGIAYAVYLGPHFARVLMGQDYITTVWSPYYRIDVIKARLPGTNTTIGNDIFINYDSFQTMADCRPECLNTLTPQMSALLLNMYEKPYHILKTPPENVLILGAGSGSDVAAALRCGAKHIDAVEIDGSIGKLGKQMHPEHPYDNPKVSLHIMDARTFLKNAHEKYDVISFPALDSHTTFSSLSSLRTDNYIFTKEAYKDALKLLTDRGVLTVCFVCEPDWLWNRHCQSLMAAAGKPPLGYFWKSSLSTGFLVTGPGVGSERPALSGAPRASDEGTDIPPINDDWPFLFLPKPGIPFDYAIPLVSVLLLSAIPVTREFGKTKPTLLDWQLMLLGMGFMLLEVRAMASLSLLFGSTTVVNSVVIGGVMLMILVANFAASKLSSSASKWSLLALIASIIVSALIPMSEFNALPMGTALGSTIQILPLLFASLLFATLFKQTQLSSRSLAFNVLGGVFGICLEYLSMSIGIRSLSWVAIAIYAVVLGLLLKNSGSAQTGSDASFASPGSAGGSPAP